MFGLIHTNTMSYHGRYLVWMNQCSTGMLKCKILLQLWVFMPIFLQAQSNLGLSLSYYAPDIVDPGLLIGLEYPLQSRKTGEKIKIWSISGQIGFSRKYRSYSALGLRSQLARRRVKVKNGNLLEINLSMGYQRNCFNAPVWQVDENGHVSESSNAGQNMSFGQISLLFGKDLSSRSNKPFSWYFGPGLNLRYPVNHQLIPGGHFLVGFTWYFTKKGRDALSRDLPDNQLHL